jgi:hypothetical protein
MSISITYVSKMIGSHIIYQSLINEIRKRKVVFLWSGLFTIVLIYIPDYLVFVCMNIFDIVFFYSFRTAFNCCFKLFVKSETFSFPFSQPQGMNLFLAKFLFLLMNIIHREACMKKTTTVLDSKPTKSVGHFEENKFSVGHHQFLLECCPKLIKIYNFGQNIVNKRRLKNVKGQYCAVRLFILKVSETFLYFFVRNCQYFLQCVLQTSRNN